MLLNIEKIQALGKVVLKSKVMINISKNVQSIKPKSSKKNGIE